MSDHIAHSETQRQRSTRGLSRWPPHSRKFPVRFGPRTGTPSPSASGKHRFVFAGVQFSHGRRDGFRVSKASRPSGARWRRSVVNAERASSSSKKTWNACPVIIIKSNRVSTDRSDALVSIHVTASAPGRRRAMSSTAVAGSAPVTVCPSAARRHASQPVPQPMSSIDLCASASCM